MAVLPGNILTMSWDTLTSNAGVTAGAVVLLTILAFYVYTGLDTLRPVPGFPVASLPGMTPTESFTKAGAKTITHGTQAYPGPFQVITGTGPKVVLPNRFAHEIRNSPFLDLNRALAPDFFVHYSGFEGFKSAVLDPTFVDNTVRTKLTPNLGLITNLIVQEVTSTVRDLFGDDPEWKVNKLKHTSFDVAARLSSRVFLGAPVCHNKRWLEIAKSYTMDVFFAAMALRATPVLIRPVAHLFLKSSKALRKDLSDARKIILPEVQRRHDLANKTLAAGDPLPKATDMIGWTAEVSGATGKKADYVGAQLALTMATIHSTAETVSGALADLINKPELIPLLRDEVINVIGKEGWSKQSLYNLRLMDSFLKESQRLHVIDAATMHRYTLKQLTLSDGTVLPKGIRIVVAGAYRDPEIWENPDDFDIYRFIRLREADNNRSNQHVSTSPEMFGFGHGIHACPGRFFVNIEMKIALCHLLLKYDWKADPNDKQPMFFREELWGSTNPNMQVMLRRRKEEIDLDIESQ